MESEEIALLKNSLQQKEKDENDYLLMVTKMQIQLSELCDLYEICLKECENLKELSKKKDGEISSLQKECSKLEWASVASQEQIKEKTKEINTLQKENEKHVEEKKKLNATIKSKDEVIRKLESEAAQTKGEFVKEVGQLEAKLQAMEIDKEKNEEKQKELESIIQDREDLIKGLEDELVETAEDYNQENEELKTVIKEKDEKNINLKNEIEKMTEYFIKEKNQMREEMNKTVEVLNEEKDKIKEEMNKLLEDKNKENAELANRAKALAQEKQDMQTEMNKVVEENIELYNRLERMEEKFMKEKQDSGKSSNEVIDAISKENAELENRAKALAQENIELYNRLERMEEKFMKEKQDSRKSVNEVVEGTNKEEQDSAKSLNEVVEVTTKEIALLKNSLQQKEKEHEALRKNLEEVKSILVEERKRRKDAEDELQLLKEKMDSESQEEEDPEEECEDSVEKMKKCFEEIMEKLKVKKSKQPKSVKRKSSPKCSNNSAHISKKKKLDTMDVSSSNEFANAGYLKNECAPKLEVLEVKEACSEIPGSNCSQDSGNISKNKKQDISENSSIDESVNMEYLQNEPVLKLEILDGKGAYNVTPENHQKTKILGSKLSSNCKDVSADEFLNMEFSENTSMKNEAAPKLEILDVKEITENHPKIPESENLYEEMKVEPCALTQSIVTESQNVENNDNQCMEQEVSCSEDLSEKLEVPEKDIQDSIAPNQETSVKVSNITSCATVQNSEHSLADCDLDTLEQVEQNSDCPSPTNTEKLPADESKTLLKTVEYSYSQNLSLSHKKYERRFLKKPEKFPVVFKNNEKATTCSSTSHAAADNSSKLDVNNPRPLSFMREALITVGMIELSPYIKKDAAQHMSSVFRHLINSNDKNLAKQYFHELFLFLLANGTESTLEKFLSIPDTKFKRLLTLQERAVIDAMSIVMEENFNAFVPLCAVFFGEMKKKIVETKYENLKLSGVYRVCAALCRLVNNPEFALKLCLIALSKDSVTGVFSVACIAAINPVVLDVTLNTRSTLDGFVNIIMYLIKEKPAALDEDLWKQATNVFCKFCNMSSAFLDPEEVFTFALNCCRGSYLEEFKNDEIEIPELDEEKIPHIWAVMALIKKEGYHWTYRNLVMRSMISSCKLPHVYEAYNQRSVPFYFMVYVHLIETSQCKETDKKEQVPYLKEVISKIKDKVPAVIFQHCETTVSKLENWNEIISS